MFIPLSGKPTHQKLVAERGYRRLIDKFHGHSDKMASGERNNGDDQPGVIGNAGGTDWDFTDKEAALKLEKSRAKSSFTRIKNMLLFLVESEDIGTCHEVQEACNKLDNCLEKAMDVMARLSGLYTKNKEKEKGLKVALESDKLEEDYNSSYDIARHYLRSLKGDQSSETSEILTINLLKRMNIDDNSGTSQKQESALQETSKKVGIFDSRDISHNIEPMKDTESPLCIETVSQKSGLSQEKRQSNAGIMNWVASGMATPNQQAESQEYGGVTPRGNQTRINAQAVPFEPAASYTAPSIGLDMWRQLK